MKRIDIALLIGLMCLGLTACDESTAGGVASASSAAKETTAEVEAAGSAGSSEAGETEAAGSAGSSEAGETEAAGTGETAGSQKIYADMDGIIFGFYSGVGAWETTLKVAPDGSFKGQFNDANMGEDGEGYKNGTIYECAFTGKFSAAEKVDDTSYSAKVEALDYEKEKNGSDHYIEDQTLHIMTDPYGLSLGDDIVIYTPGKKTSELSEGFMSWMTWKIPDDAKELDQIAIYNTTGDYVFYPDFYAMGTEEPTEGAPTESKAYLNLKNSYYSQAMPPYYQTPFVPEVPEAPSKSYSSVSIENLQGRWVNRYKEGKVQVEEVLSVNGNRGRIETFMDGVQQGVWNGEGIIDIEDRSARKVCPAFRIYDDTGDAVCVIYIRWVKDKAFFDGGFVKEWKREGTDRPDQYLYDTVTLDNLQGVWYTEDIESDGLHQVVLTVDEDRATLFETIEGVPSKFWNGGGEASIVMQDYLPEITVPELIIQMETGPATGSAGIYVSGVSEDMFYDRGFNRWYVKVRPDFLMEEDQETPEVTMQEDGSGLLQGTNRYEIRKNEKKAGNGNEDEDIVEWTVEASNDDGMKETLAVEVESYVTNPPDFGTLVEEWDVNFDGIPDVLLYLGAYSPRGDSYYQCYLSDGKTLKLCQGFDEIPNPWADAENKEINSTVRDGAEAYYDLVYRVEGDKAVKVSETRYVYDEKAGDYIPGKE